MKFQKNSLRCCAFIFVLFLGLHLKAQRIAFLDMDSLLSMMPEHKVMLEKNKAKLKELETFLEKLQATLTQQSSGPYQGGNAMSKEEIARYQEDFQKKELRIQQVQKDAQKEYFQFTMQTKKPIDEKN